MSSGLITLMIEKGDTVEVSRKISSWISKEKYDLVKKSVEKFPSHAVEHV